MSGVYIKGMEMPKSCFYCPFREKVNPDDYVCMALNKEFEETFSLIVGKRHKDCPLVPVPPHGRLIDADAFISQKMEQICKNCDRRRGMKDGKLTNRFVYAIGDAPCRACEAGDMIDYVDDAPTIIPAEDADHG